MSLTPCKCGFPNIKTQHVCMTPAKQKGTLPEQKPAPVVPCSCGYHSNRIQHTCLKPLGRAIKPCKCGFRDADVQHVCAIKPLAVRLKEKRERLLNPPKRPDNMCEECPKDNIPCIACWVRAGYAESGYYRTFPEMRPKRERVVRPDWKKVPANPKVEQSEETLAPPPPETAETLPELPEAESSERYLQPEDLAGEE